jgi:competence protein ComEC
MQKSVISLTLAYSAGLLIGRGFLYFPYSISVLATLSILLSGILTWSNKPSLRRFFVITLPCLAGMIAYIYSAAWFPSHHYTRIFPAEGTLHEMTGRIVSPLDRDPDKTGFVLGLSQIDNTTVTGKLGVSVREELVSVGYGDTVRVKGKLFGPRGFDNPGGFDYPAYLAQSGIHHVVSVKNADTVKVISRGTGIFRTIQDWRERIRQAFLASTVGPGSAILQAMVLGEEGGLTDDIRDQFMAAGVTHIISISGSHLGLVALLCFGFVRWLLYVLPERLYHRLTIRVDPKKIAAWAVILPVTFYAFLAGGQTATLRSLVMILAAIAAILLDRENGLLHSLAAAALAILIASPQAIFDISFQLSYIAVLVIGHIVMLWNDLQFKAGTRLQKTRNSAILLVIISLSTSLATGPILVHYFNQFSLAGVVSNMIVVPFAGMMVVPLGLLSGILSLFMHRLPLPALNQFVSDFFISTVSSFSRLPFAEFHPPSPGVLWLIGYAVFLFSLFRVLRSKLVSRFLPFESSARASRLHIVMMIFPGMLLMIPLALSFTPKQKTTVSFPDVGQGDCALLELSSGRNILIDGGGTYDDRFDTGRRVLAPFLWNRGVRRLDLVILSHPHPDHMNGLKFILKKFDVSETWSHGLDTDLPGYEDFRQVIVDKKINHRIVSTDDPPSLLGATELRLLHPVPGFRSRDRKAYAAENSRSLVVKIRSEGRVFLFSGDIGIEAENDILRRGQDLKCDLLKVPHHGSKSSSSWAFVSLTKPAIAVVTVGRGNRYHHPSDDVIKRYERAGAQVCRTDADGAVMVKADTNSLDIMRWRELVLRRINLDERMSWGERERQNWSRLRIRATAF